MELLAISGGKPVRQKEFTKWPIYDKREEENLIGVLYKSKWGIGKRTGVINEFEEKFSGYHNRRFGISNTNCSHSLEIVLAANGIGAGDEVIVPSYTFIATASAVCQVGAVPIFTDVNASDYCLNPDSVESLISDKTRAIIAVHFAGHFADMLRLSEIAKKNNLLLIEDAAQAHGAKWNGDFPGKMSVAATFSFQYSKNMTAGEGGIILTDSNQLADAYWEYIWHGRKKQGLWYEHFRTSSNYRMTEWQAAVLLAQLEKLPEQNRIRDLNGRFLDEELAKISGVEPLRVDPLTNIHPRHLYIFKLTDKEIPKEIFIKALNAEGIPALPGYGFPLYKNPAFLNKKFGSKSCQLKCRIYNKEIDYTGVYNENAEKACKECIWILHNVLLGQREDMKDIVAAIKKVLENKRELLSATDG